MDKTWKELLPHLTGTERDKVLRFRFDADRIRAITGICLIKSGIKQAYPNEDAAIALTELGKPYVRDRTGYEFNLSHSGSIISFASDAYPVGVDVELVKDKDWRIFHRYLTDEEMSIIEEAEDQKECFFEIWTIREAFAKEEGQGLKILDKDFDIDYMKHRIIYEGKRLYFNTFDHVADERYKISICSPHDVSDAEITVLSKSDWDKCLKSGLFSKLK